MQKKINLQKAKATKNDEFYTQLSDIERELKYYKEHFKDKVVFCNCDDPEWSNFWTFFSLKFNSLSLKKLIATHYNQDGNPSYKLEITRDKNGNVLEPIKTKLKGNGDFRSEECVELLKEADIVCTNPPFSLFREYVAQLIEHNKKFLIIGNMNSITYKEIFKYIQENKLWLGISPRSMEFFQNAEDVKMQNKNNLKGVNAVWFTNLEHYKRNDEIHLYKSVFDGYKKYDNCDAIDIEQVKNIPKDYFGLMGVPITFMDKYNPKQFEIIRFRKGDDGKDLKINGKDLYCRILIKRKLSN